MDLVTWGVFLLFFLLAGAGVFFISVYGTSEQSFEDGLLDSGDKKKDRKSAGKKEEAGAKSNDAAAGVKKRTGKFSKKKDEEKEAKVGEPKPAEPVVAKKPKEQIEAVKPEPVIEKNVEPAAVVEEVVAAPVKIAKQEEAAPKKAAKAEEKKATGAKSKILIEDVESEVAKAAPPAVVDEVKKVKEAKAEPAKAKAEPVKLVESVEEIKKEENAVQKSEEAKPVEAPSKPAKKKEVSGKSGAAPATSKLTDPNAIISAVKMVSLEERQVQQLIDILLNKQQSSSVNGFPGSPGGDWSGDKATNQLKRQLAEAQAELDDERLKNKSLTDRLGVLRTEFNQTKSAQMSAQRMLDDIQKNKQNDTKQWESRLQAETDKRIREVQQWQETSARSLNQAQALQTALDSLKQKQQLVDPAVVDSLRAAKSQLEAELAAVQAQLGHSTAQLNEANEAKAKILAELAQAKGDAEKKSAELLQKNSALSESETVCKDLRTKLSEAVSAQKSLEAEKLRLADETARLSQLHKKAESELVTAQANAPVKSEAVKPTFDKGVYLNETKAAAKQWEDFFNPETFSAAAARPTLIDVYHQEPAVNGSAVNGDHDCGATYQIERALATGDAMVASLINSLSSVKSKLEKVETELSQQRTKNNDVESVKCAVQKDLKVLLQSQFSDISVADNDGDFAAWSKTFLSAVESKLHDASAVSKSDVETLEKQANHYKTILAETEMTLLKLQTEVESMESNYAAKVSEQATTIADSEKKIQEIVREKAAFEGKAADLQKKLDESAKRLQELEAAATEKSSEPDASAEELSASKAELERERKSVSELNEQVARLNQAVATSQKALEQEKRISEKLRNQLSERTADTISPGPETVENGNSKASPCEAEKTAA